MKKTILTFAAAVLLVATSVNANGKTSLTSIPPILTIAPLNVSTFCKAIMKGDIETVKKLIEFGEDVNKKSLGKTPAIYAARYNKTEILKILIANGANLKIKCDKGRSVKKHAELSNAKGALEIIENELKKRKSRKKK